MRLLGIRTFIVLYLSLQLLLPTLGLFATRSDSDGSGFPFSWHMFSRIPKDDGNAE